MHLEISRRASCPITPGSRCLKLGTPICADVNGNSQRHQSVAAASGRPCPQVVVPRGFRRKRGLPLARFLWRWPGPIEFYLGPNDFHAGLIYALEVPIDFWLGRNDFRLGLIYGLEAPEDSGRVPMGSLTPPSHPWAGLNHIETVPHGRVGAAG